MSKTRLLLLHRRMRADNETTHPTSNSNALRIILSIFKCNNENYEQELRNNKLTDVCLTPSNTAYWKKRRVLYLCSVSLTLLSCSESALQSLSILVSYNNIKHLSKSLDLSFYSLFTPQYFTNNSLTGDQCSNWPLPPWPQWMTPLLPSPEW